MKLTKLLVLGVMLLIGGNAMALTERTKPAPQKTQGFEVGSEDNFFYLYNLDAQAFFTEGNSWGTQASVGSTGLKVYFSKFENEETGVEWDGKTYLFNDFSVAKNAWKVVFFNDEVSMYVDRASQDDYGWAVDTNGDTFRLHVSTEDSGINPYMSEEEYPDMFVGLDVTENPGNTALTPILEEGDGHYIEWALVTPEEYDVYVAQVDAYEVSVELYKKLVEAQELGIDIAAWEAIYEDLSSTVEQLKAAIAEVDDALNDYKEKVATWENPQSMNLIANPDFAESATEGWSGTAAALGYGAAEHYNKTYNTYQDLTNMPNGVYRLRLQGFYRAGSTAAEYKNQSDPTKRYGKIYAKSGDDELTKGLTSNYNYEGAPAGLGASGETSYTDADGITWYVPNTMESFSVYAAAGNFWNELYFAVDTREARIGLKKDSLISTDWTIWDNWELTYYGNSEDAFKGWAGKVVDNADNYDDVVASTPVKEAYQEVVAEAAEASNKADILAAIAAIDKAAADVVANMNAWVKLLATMAQAESVAANPMFEEEYRDICQEILEEAQDAYEEMELSTEEVLELNQRLDDAVLEAKNHIPAHTDVTALFLVNPGYDNGSEGWIGQITDIAHSCAEAFMLTNFDHYQVVRKAPVGVYTISVQGFYRGGDNATAWAAYQAADGNIPSKAYVYMNNNATPFANLYDVQIPITLSDEEHIGPNADIFNLDPDHNYISSLSPFEAEDADGNPIWFANNMSQSQDAFEAGYYKQKAYGIVAREGDELRIGVKGNLDGTNEWCIWDTFELVYEGLDADIMGGLLKEKADELQATLDDAKVGPTMRSEIEALIASARTAAEGDDGQAMLDALNDIFNATDAIAAAVAKYDELAAAIAAFEVVVSNSTQEDAKAQAEALLAKAQEGYEGGLFESEEIDDIIAQMKNMRTALVLGDYAVGTDCTPVIENASYDANTNDGWEGTTPGFQTYTNAEVYNSTFDVYQDLIGLKEGTYELRVQAFYRAGFAADDYSDYNGDNAHNEAVLYGKSDISEVSEPLARLAAEAIGLDYENGDSETGLISGYVQIDGTQLQVPNNMETAAMAFKNGQYANKLAISVGEGGTLRIGIKKDENIDGSWVIFDNWELWYTSAEINAIREVSNAPVVRVEYFNLNGVRVNQPQKGIILMRSTLSDGTVVVKKLNVK